jgi:hypothetical protein
MALPLVGKTNYGAHSKVGIELQKEKVRANNRRNRTSLTRRRFARAFGKKRRQWK